MPEKPWQAQHMIPALQDLTFHVEDLHFMHTSNRKDGKSDKPNVEKKDLSCPAGRVGIVTTAPAEQLGEIQ